MFPPAYFICYPLATFPLSTEYGQMKCGTFMTERTYLFTFLKPMDNWTSSGLGRRLEQGEQLQAVVPAGCWFASRVEQPSGFALTGCTVAPGFDFQDFEMAKRNDLITQFPDHRKLIEELTRDT